ncbi:related to flavohemoglobin [Cephalotrichum gorgonifer]|uniref:nitric oxide dioxygenase n=1 Tax=Cephalotrichum gorgonifer TaxID=2041049 RepID=A0AAE8N5A6_9PEZI|nr:related to flavohemoglobin [Cephalotrichum gorgonifer]
MFPPAARRILSRRIVASNALPRLFSTSAPKMALTAEQIAIVKSTAPILREHGETITTVFYKNMMEAHPSLKNVFSLRNQQSGAQQRALSNAVIAYATYIDDLGKILPVVERIAHKHAALFIKPEQYAIVGEHLMGAIGEVLGDGLTEEVAAAWTAAYGQLADVFIGREAELYKAPGEDLPVGWRKFKIAKRVDESESVTSFFLEPVDGVTPLPAYLPGQYVSLQVPVPGVEGLLQSRQFSLSEAQTADRKSYRVSVKREFTTPDAPIEDVASGKVTGLVSNILHGRYQVGDVVELSRPQGDFHVDVTDASKADAPIVLLSAGVGVTPLRAILDSVLEDPASAMKGRPVSWVQASRNRASEVFGAHVKELAARHENVSAKIFWDEIAEGDVQGVDYHFPSRLDLGALDAEKDLFVGNDKAEYYICGPVEWMLSVRKGLEGLGVPRERLRLELFGTGSLPEE